MGDNYIPPYLLIFLHNADVRFSTAFFFLFSFSPLFFFFFSFFPGVSVKEEQSTSLRLFQPKINSEKNGTDRPIAREAEQKLGDSSYVCKIPY